MAVVGAISGAGELVQLNMCPKFISKEVFIEFMKALKDQPKPCTLLVDNLSMHKMKEVRAAAEEFGLQLMYNAAYSSELNPIERLWGKAKEAFRQNIIDEENYKDQKLITAYAERSIRSVK